MQQYIQLVATPWNWLYRPTLVDRC